MRQRLCDALVLSAALGCAPAPSVRGGGGADPVVDPPAGPRLDATACTASYAWDADDDGAPDALGVDVYDAATHLVRRTERDWDLDGAADEIETWYRDERGDVLAHQIDEDGSGTPSWILTATWSDTGRQLTEVTDEDVDGLPDRIVAWTWNDDDTLAAEVVDRDGDGVPEQSTTYTHADGVRVADALDNDADGEPDVFGAWTYDGAGRDVAYATDRYGDGTVEYEELTAYDGPSGRSGTITVDRGSDGEADELTTRRYDERGKLVYERVDTSPDDGLPDHETHLAWADGLVVAEDGTQDLGPPLGVVTFAIRRAFAHGDLPAEQVVTITTPDGASTTSRETWEVVCP